ncbi:MAG: hypothetical protein ACO3IB_07375 [Phycisphaerales bacterium]
MAVLRGIAGGFLGVVSGAALNMGILLGGARLLPPPAGVDVNDVATINANIDKYSVLDLSVPFAAHALGTLVGAFIAASVAATPRGRLRAASFVGILFLLGGIEAIRMIPNAPLWFDALDLCVAYLPMAWIGWRVATRGKASA